MYAEYVLLNSSKFLSEYVIIFLSTETFNSGSEFESNISSSPSASEKYLLRFIETEEFSLSR